MSESKFTPGPWLAVENGFTKMAVISGEGHYLTYAAGNDRMNDQVLEANAKLIAAAPDMIAALERAAIQFRYYEQAHREKGTDDSMRKAEVNAGLAYDIEQVIAKATA